VERRSTGESRSPGDPTARRDLMTGRSFLVRSFIVGGFPEFDLIDDQPCLAYDAGGGTHDSGDTTYSASNSARSLNCTGYPRFTSFTWRGGGEVNERNARLCRGITARSLCSLRSARSACITTRDFAYTTSPFSNTEVNEVNMGLSSHLRPRKISFTSAFAVKCTKGTCLAGGVAHV